MRRSGENSRRAVEAPLTLNARQAVAGASRIHLGDSEGKHDFTRRLLPSIFSICARKDSMAGSGRKLVIDLR